MKNLHRSLLFGGLIGGSYALIMILTTLISSLFPSKSN